MSLGSLPPPFLFYPPPGLLFLEHTGHPQPSGKELYGCSLSSSFSPRSPQSTHLKCSSSWSSPSPLALLYFCLPTFWVVSLYYLSVCSVKFRQGLVSVLFGCAPVPGHGSCSPRMMVVEEPPMSCQMILVGSLTCLPPLQHAGLPVPSASPSRLLD